MNPVAMTIINTRKEYWPSCGSNQRPPALKSAKLPSELWGSAEVMRFVQCRRNTLIEDAGYNYGIFSFLHYFIVPEAFYTSIEKKVQYNQVDGNIKSLRLRETH